LRRCFALPPKIQIASIWSIDERTKRVSGDIDFAPEQPIWMRVSAMLEVYPAFIDKVAADDVDYLRLSDMDPADVVLTRITHWKKLELLMIDGGSIKDKGWESIQKLPNLQNLVVKKTVFDWRKFAQLSCLNRLHSLRVEECSSIVPLLEHLPVMNNLLNLDAGDSRPGWITSSCLRSLARQRNLRRLFLTVKGSSNNERAAATLGMEVEKDNRPRKQTTLSSDDITALASMKNLQSLHLPKPDMSESELRAFLKRVPAARSNEWAQDLHDVSK